MTQVQNFVIGRSTLSIAFQSTELISEICQIPQQGPIIDRLDLNKHKIGNAKPEQRSFPNNLISSTISNSGLLVILASREAGNIDITHEAPGALVIPHKICNSGINLCPIMSVFIAILICVNTTDKVVTADHRTRLLVPKIREVLTGNVVAVALVFEAGEVVASVE